MSRSFPKTDDLDAVVGQTPRSGRVPQNPHFGETSKADVGVGCGPWGPPHLASKMSDFGKSK